MIACHRLGHKFTLLYSWKLPLSASFVTNTVVVCQVGGWVDGWGRLSLNLPESRPDDRSIPFLANYNFGGRIVAPIILSALLPPPKFAISQGGGARVDSIFFFLHMLQKSFMVSETPCAGFFLDVIFERESWTATIRRYWLMQTLRWRAVCAWFTPRRSAVILQLCRVLPSCLRFARVRVQATVQYPQPSPCRRRAACPRTSFFFLLERDGGGCNQ